MDLVSDILSNQSLKGFNVLTIWWPAGFEEDLTASGSCEPGDLKPTSGKNREREEDRNDGTTIGEK